MDNRSKYLLLIGLALVWGTSFILIKKSVQVFTPYQVGALRVTMAGCILIGFGFPALKKINMRTLSWIALAGCLGNFIPMYLFPIAEVKVSSSLAGILNSLVPIFTLIFGFIFFKKSNSMTQMFGALLGFVGAFLLMYFSHDNHTNNPISYALLIVLATISYALSGLIVEHKLRHVKSLQLSGLVFGIWLIPSIVVLLFSGFFTQFNGSALQWEALGYVSLLSIIGTAMAMILFYKLIQDTSAVFASSVTYLIPIVAVLWGVLDGETLNIWFLVGGILILLGIYFIRDNPKLDNLVK